MDNRISLLRERRERLKNAGSEVRERIALLVDEDSFVELAAFSFSKDLFYEENEDEGVVTGFATIGGYPFYIVAQNFAALKGGLSKAGCEKIAKALDAAEQRATPVVYLLHSQGVRVGEGVNVLEGIAGLLKRAAALKGTVLQFAVLEGEVYGSSAALAAQCDVVLFEKDAVLSVASTFVLSAKAGKNLKATEVGGYLAPATASLPAVEVADLREAASVILSVSDLVGIADVEADLNDALPALNEKADAETLLSLLENRVELGGNANTEVRTVLGRLGGIAVAAVVMDGMRINAENLKKIRRFAEFACYYGLPYLTLVDCAGIETDLAEYASVRGAMDAAKVSVVTGSAIGLGYTLFAAKSAGYGYVCALATAKIALFEENEGAEIECEGADKEKLAAYYAAETSDPFHAARGGYLDDIVEPQFVKQYVLAAIEMLR